MLTEQAVNRLEALVMAQPEPVRMELRGALEDLARVIATQALLARNLGIELENAMVGVDVLNSLVAQNGLEGMLSGLSPPKRNPFSMGEARKACDDLVATASQARDFTAILKGVAQVAKVLI